MTALPVMQAAIASIICLLGGIALGAGCVWLLIAGKHRRGHTTSFAEGRELLESTGESIFVETKHESPRTTEVRHERERIEPRSASSDQHILQLVDLLDELDQMPANAPSATLLAIFKERIFTMIELADGEIIRDTIWSPDRQRAVGSSNTEGSPKQLITKRSGLLVKGNLIRKQEVILTE